MRLVDAERIVVLAPHPDDEALVCGGLIARLTAAGRRVTIVTATDGAMQSLDGAPAPRLAELAASAAVLGATSTTLGYADSGHGPLLYDDPADRPRFVRVPVDEAAAALATVVDAEDAGLVIGIEPGGITGHRDHRHASLVAQEAARRTGASHLAMSAPWALRRATHGAAARHRLGRVDVRAFVDAKLAAMACHASELAKDNPVMRAVRAITAMPLAARRALAGTEWFVA